MASSAAAPVHELLRLSRDTAMPLYRQLSEQLVDLIRQGAIPAGYTLPAERSLAEVLGVSRATVQQCYNDLRERGMIRGHGRHGSVTQALAPRLSPGMDRLRGFTQEMADFGRRASSRVLEHAIVTDAAIAAKFELPPAARFLRLVRVRLGDDIPMSVESAWYSLDAAPSLARADVTGSIYSQLADSGMVLRYCDQTIEAILAAEAEQAIFGFAGPHPCLMIKRRSYVGAGQMVEYVEGIFRGDIYTYHLRLEA